MIPHWMRKVKPWRLRKFVTDRYIESHIDHWDQNGIALDLRSISKAMREHITSGNYESSEIDLCSKYVEASDSVLEIGSAIGFVSLFCLKIIGVKQICCVEPNPTTAAILKKNYALNGFSPTLIEACFTGTDGTFNLSASSDFWIDRIQESENPSGNNTIEVFGCSLESILSQTPFQPSVIVMDVEGAELALTPTDIPHYIKYLILETHPRICGWNESYKHISQFLYNGFSICETAGDVFVLRNDLF
ncbi:MAG: FkbM family methyltransferase [Akkermansiaceae bacterium]|nr:FkbM family methyltransferase [Akkermansiaceae bacterium]